MLGWSRSRYMLAKVKAYMDVIGAIHLPLNTSIDDIKGTQIKRGSSVMAKAETKYKGGH